MLRIAPRYTLGMWGLQFLIDAYLRAALCMIQNTNHLLLGCLRQCNLLIRIPFRISIITFCLVPIKQQYHSQLWLSAHKSLHVVYWTMKKCNFPLQLSTSRNVTGGGFTPKKAVTYLWSLWPKVYMHEKIVCGEGQLPKHKRSTRRHEEEFYLEKVQAFPESQLTKDIYPLFYWLG